VPPPPLLVPPPPLLLVPALLVPPPPLLVPLPPLLVPPPPPLLQAAGRVQLPLLRPAEQPAQAPRRPGQQQQQ
jgi:WAS family protein 2